MGKRMVQFLRCKQSVLERSPHSLGPDIMLHPQFSLTILGSTESTVEICGMDISVTLLVMGRYEETNYPEISKTP